MSELFTENSRHLPMVPYRLENPLFSIIVCTRDRADKLIGCLDAIVAAMKAAPDVRSELVVVDSASEDATAAYLVKWAFEQTVRVVRLHDPVPGLARARNLGMRESEGSVVIMTDDDCIMDVDYLKHAKRFHKHPYLIGGKVMLGDETDLPISIRLGDEPEQYGGRNKPSGFVIGANLTFHRWIWEALGGFDESFGAGARYRAGEDTDFMFRAWWEGFIVRYEPDLVVRHFHGRSDPSEADRLLRGYSVADGALYRKHLHTLRPFRYLAQAAKAKRWGVLRHNLLGVVS